MISPGPGPQQAAPGLRILAISSDCYPPARVDVSILFGRHMASRGHRVDWLLQSEAECRASRKESWGGGVVWVGPTDLGESIFRRVRKHALGIRHDLRIFGILNRGQYDLVTVKDKFLSGIFAAIAARLGHKPFLYWLSYPFPEDYLHRARDGSSRYPFLYWVRGTVFRFLLYRVLLRCADHVLVQSEQMKRDLVEQGVPARKMTAVPMGIDDDLVLDGAQSSAGRALLPAGQPCVLYLGTLARVRRLDFLVRVIVEVRKSMPTARLFVVGAGDDPRDEQLLVDEAARLGDRDALVLLGRKPRDVALQYVREADVCVSPFAPVPILNSTSPTKLVEYMAMGKAVVANDHPEQRLVLEESGGGLCVPWDERAFAAAIIKLLADPDSVARMGAAGRRYVAEHRVYSKIADAVERQLTAVVSNSKN